MIVKAGLGHDHALPLPCGRLNIPASQRSRDAVRSVARTIRAGVLLDPALEVARGNARGAPDMHGGQFASAQQLVDGGAAEAQDRRNLIRSQEQTLRQGKIVAVSRGHVMPPLLWNWNREPTRIGRCMGRAK